MQFEHPGELLELSAGQEMGVSEWLEISQQRIDQFAAATGDHQWIHVDPERAKDGPYGACIAHGYLIMSLTNLFLPDICLVKNFSLGINYGTNRVRFIEPVLVGARIRGRGQHISAKPIGEQAVQIVTQVTIEIDGNERPACVVEAISRFFYKTKATTD